MTNPRISDRVCFVCARSAIGIGYAPPRAKSIDQVAWCCDDPECIQIAKDSYMMKQLEFGRLEQLATGDAGDEGGAYLDEIGKTDLATLTPAEWHIFLERVIGGYRAALKGRLRDEAPF
jgi:hypothetical protein